MPRPLALSPNPTTLNPEPYTFCWEYNPMGIYPYVREKKHLKLQVPNKQGTWYLSTSSQHAVPVGEYLIIRYLDPEARTS